MTNLMEFLYGKTKEFTGNIQVNGIIDGNELHIDGVRKDNVWADSANAMGVVVHGATAGTARPTGYAQITWIGSVEPDNKATNDIWIEKE